MAKELVIGRCYNQPPIVLTTGMTLKQLAAALKALEGHEVTRVAVRKV